MEIHYGAIVPFDRETARHFVYKRRNIFDDKTVRRVIYDEDNLIVVKEIGYFRNGRRVWFWGFARDKYGIIMSDIKNGEAINRFKEVLLDDSWSG